MCPEGGAAGDGRVRGFHTFQTRLLALIAARNYDQAREYLELAADLTQEQHDRFEQMISALELMRSTSSAGTADPSLWKDWLAAFNKA
jgi:hypothetical protein